MNQTGTIEATLSSPDRVHCLPYSANLSREACLRQQEIARQRMKANSVFGLPFWSRQACLRCKTGKALRTQEDKPAPPAPGRQPRPGSCRFHPDRPRHRDLQVCLPCYRTFQARIARIRREMQNASYTVRKIQCQAVADLQRQMGIG